MIFVSTGCRTAVAITCWLCLINATWAQSESLPEMVKRHDQEIKSLREVIDSLRAQPANSGADQKGTAPGCVRDLKVVGKYSYSRQQLDDVVTVKDTGFSFKVVKMYGSPYSVILASNVDALNNKTLIQGNSYKFALRNCNYVLFIDDVTPGNSNNPLTFSLNYD